MISKITYSMNNMDFPKKNVFDIDEPETFACMLYKFDIGHSTLTICGDRKNATPEKYRSFTATFGGVTHFDGPIRWTGANFCLADLATHLEFTSKYFKKQLSRDIQSFLFEIPTDGYTIKFVARHYAMIEPGALWEK